jgi:hypothetical protein
MSMIVPQAAELNTLTDMIADILSAEVYMRLLSSNVTINSTTTLAALLAGEASFTGYAKVQLTTWGSPVIDGSGAASSTCTQGQFTPTAGGGSGNLYGYFLTDSAGTKMWGVEAFSGAPITVPQSVTLEVDLTYTVLSRY